MLVYFINNKFYAYKLILNICFIYIFIIFVFFESRHLIYATLVFNSFFNILVSLIITYYFYVRYMLKLFRMQILNSK